MSHQRGKLYVLISRTLRRFKFQELEEMMDALMPEQLSVPDIVKKLKRAKLSLNGRTFAEMALKDFEKLSNEDLHRLSLCFQLFDRAYHNRKTKWECVELLERSSEQINADSSLEAVTGAVLQSIRISKLNAFVEVLKHTDDYFYICIQEKKIIKGKRVILRSPIFCACNFTDPYLFFTPKTAAQNIILTRVTVGLGYDDMKLCALDGRSIPALARILKNRHKNQALEVYNPVDVVRTADGLNYCMDTERQKYASKVFGGDDPIELEALTVQSSVPFRGLRMLPEAEDVCFTSTLKITAPSLAEFVEGMASDRALAIPFPTWLSKVPNLGKNTFQITTK